MSLEIKDFRKFREAQAAKEAQTQTEKKAPLLEQAPTEAANTGDKHLDKMLRVIEAAKVTLEAQLQDLAIKGMESIPSDQIRFFQTQYRYVQGRLHQLKELADIPAQIIAEDKMFN